MGFRNFLNAVLALFLAFIFLFRAGSKATSGVRVGPLSYGSGSAVTCFLSCAVPAGEKTDLVGELWVAFCKVFT